MTRLTTAVCQLRDHVLDRILTGRTDDDMALLAVRLAPTERCA